MAAAAGDSPLTASPDEWAASNYITFETTTARFGVAALEKLALQPGERFIDIASGPGMLALHAAGLGAKVDAIDFAPAMIEALNKRLAAAPEAADVRAHVMDGQALAFDDGAFHAACSCFGVILFPDYALGLREMLRVLKPGGRAAVVSWSDPLETASGPWLEKFAAEGVDVDSKRPPGWRNMATEEGMAGELRGAGFVDVEATPVAVSMRIESARDYCTIGARNPMMQALLRALPEQRQAVFVEELIGELEGRYGQGVFEFPTRGLVGFGKKPV